MGENHAEGAETERLLELSESHKQFLIDRHGTSELDPLPSDDPGDPLNWPRWKKVINLALITFQTTSAGIVAAGIVPAYSSLSVQYGTSIQTISYLTSVQILILGIAPWFWDPISRRYGRRPVFLVAVLVSCIANVGSALCETYVQQTICRVVQAWFISPAFGLGGMVVAETFFSDERARFMGVWTTLTTLGPPLGPFIMGFVAYNMNYNWIFWIFAMMNGFQFLLQVFFGPETRYIRNQKEEKKTGWRQQYLTFRRFDHSPVKFSEFYEPARIAWGYLNIWIPALAHGVVFMICSVFLTIIVPQLFIPRFDFNEQQIGLQYLGIIIGTVVGEQASGPLSDWWMNWRARRDERAGHSGPAPETRLWVSYLGFLTSVVGLVVFCVQLHDLKGESYNVSPVVGAGIAAFGNQVVTTVLITYSTDCHDADVAAPIGSFVNAVRQGLGFIGPFWFTAMYTNLGLKGSAGLLSGLIIAISVSGTAFLQLRRRFRPHQD